MFISYRHKGGAEQAEVLSTFLRTGGIVPWFDGSDLAGGLVAHNVRSAIEEGISAGILLVTPGLEESEFVRDIELPLLATLDAAAAEAAVPGMPLDFRLYILQALGERTEYDPGEIDRLLRTDEAGYLARLGGEPLASRLQYSQRELPRLLSDLLRQRIGARHVDLADRQVTVWVQTRPAPYVDRHVRMSNNDTVDLAVRLRQDQTTSIPRELDYRCFQLTLPLLADAIYAAVLPHRTDAAGTSLKQMVTIAGGGHPSVMWALGSALPEARHAFGTVEVRDIRQDKMTRLPIVWTDTPLPNADARYEVTALPPATAEEAPERGARS